ncbi:MAG: glycosyltransferase family 2 protein [Crocinitomicaceae bacterium]|jgi:dolichol-phosphate mannosyltransferase|nr:glycosyltransferase family 2 protein [Crocinitomicaceae bacterium]MCF8444920.1 glycosyltransferase family 2 protein [Crocinitomicaceae bacterium]
MQDPEISIIIPTYSEEGNIFPLYTKLIFEMNQMNIDSFEIVYVNDGSKDNSLVKIKELVAQDSRVRYIHFSRNFGHQNALRAGLDFATGNAVISMDADLQHPPELIPTLINHWREGYKIVFTKRKDTNDMSFFKKLSSKLFYKLVNYLSETKLEEGTADFRLLDRSVVEALKKFKENNLFYRGIVPSLGFKQIGIDYVPNERFSGETKYTFSKMVRFALTGITSSSAKPLYFSIYLGAFLALCSFFYGLYAIYISIFTSNAITGWTSIIASILFIGGIQLIMLGIVGIYLGKLFSESKNRPSYIIEEKN